MAHELLLYSSCLKVLYFLLDSPKHKAIRGFRNSAGSPRRLRKKVQRPSEIVVVREATSQDSSMDPQLAKLQVKYFIFWLYSEAQKYWKLKTILLLSFLYQIISISK